MSIPNLSAAAVRRQQRVVLMSVIERLESRQLLSAAAPDPGTFALVNTPITGAYTPAQLRTAYGVSALGTANEGQGTTIGIVDELDDPNITGDANAFSAEYNLPLLDGVGGDPTMTVFKDTALASVGSASGTGVAEETTLDVEMAHAMAPEANILLVEVPATGSTANAFVELLHGVQVAAQKGAQSVSLSYGTSESSIGASGVVSQNNTYLATGAAASIAVSVSTGDGSSPSFPATSPNVLAVGGTSLYLASVKGTYSFETAWGGLAGAGAGGGGASSNFATPTFQSNNGVNYGERSIPDVALDADPVTAVSTYDTLDDGGGNPWSDAGGTSVASPIFAGIIALAQQNRISASLPVLSSIQIDTEMYSLYNSPAYTTYFHDITQGSNKDVSSGNRTTVTGYSAATGYDLATGLGSPIASALVPALSTLRVGPTVRGVGSLLPTRGNPVGGMLASPISSVAVGGLFGTSDSDSSIDDGAAAPVVSSLQINAAVYWLTDMTELPIVVQSNSQTDSTISGVASPISDAFGQVGASF